MKIDLIIPTYKPDENFLELVKLMENQSIELNKIIVINTEQKFFDRMTYTSTFSSKYKNLEVRHISKKEFDHGKTRNEAVKRSDADYFLMMTQDAKPVDDRLVETLLKRLKEDESLAAVYARQIPRDDADEAERYARLFNYPKESEVHSLADVKHKGIKAYYCSNVCAMYRRSTFDELGGFLNHVIFNEDMLYAAKAINSGYRIAYEAEAMVVHSHSYKNKQQYKRYFDNGVSHAKHPEIFNDLPAEGEGMRLVKGTIAHLNRTGHALKVIPFIVQSGYKYLGFKAGLHYKRFSSRGIAKRTLNPEYWMMDELMRDRSNLDVYQGYGKSEEELRMLAAPPVGVRSEERRNGESIK